MRIIDSLQTKSPFISLEFFPPKERKDWPAFFEVARTLGRVKPLFVSVTYGAGGSTQANTLDIVRTLKSDLNFEPMAHFTCVGATKDKLRGFLSELQAAGVDNVLALRGDPPPGAPENFLEGGRFQHASDLVEFIRSEFPALGVGVAGYPEVHPQAVSPQADLEFLKLKVEKGGQIVVTQLFFDNAVYFEFKDRCRAAGIDAPIIPGVLPILSAASIKRIVGLCGARIPDELMRQVLEADERGGAAAVSELGVSYALSQAKGLLDGGAPGVHLYTLNKAEACLRIAEGLAPYLAS